MKIHPDLIGHAEVDEKGLLELAKKVGLDQIDFNGHYKMCKLRAKDEKASRFLEPGHYTRGFPYLIGNGTTFVAIFIYGLSDWMKTSPIVAVKKVEKGFEIETENSFYLLSEI